MWDKAGQALRRMVTTLRVLVGMGLLLILTLIGCADDTKTVCAPVALYGPPPCNDDKDCANWQGPGWYCDKANTFSNGCGGTSTWAICKQGATDAGPAKDLAKTDACEPVALYGPKPCTSDDECITDHGGGWYCDKSNTFGNGCGGTSTWPICRQRTTPDGGVKPPDGCMPVALYGPPPCNTDDDCVKWYGAGYTCNKNNTYSNGCGGTSTWPVCEKK